MRKRNRLVLLAIAVLGLVACTGGGQTVEHQTLGPGGQPYSYETPAPRY